MPWGSMVQYVDLSGVKVGMELFSSFLVIFGLFQVRSGSPYEMC